MGKILRFSGKEATYLETSVWLCIWLLVGLFIGLSISLIDRINFYFFKPTTSTSYVYGLVTAKKPFNKA